MNLFSSPEQDMLKGSFWCDDVSIEHRQHFLILPNHWANLDQTWQECALGGPFSKIVTEFDSVKNWLPWQQNGIF